MKTIILSLLLLAAGSTVCFAQCDKKVSLSSSKSEHLDASGNVEGSKDEKTTVVIGKTDLTVSITSDDGDQKMTGPVKSRTCDWKVPFKEGKLVVTTTLSDQSGGNEKDFTITIEGKDGKITLTAETPAMPDKKIRLLSDKFEEVK